MPSQQSILRPKAPAAAWLHSLVTPSLTTAAPYKIDTPPVTIKLDQNESPWDLPAPVKEKVLSRLMAMPWNRYPPAFADELAAKVAAHIGVEPNAVLLGPGSNYLVSLVLSVFAKSIAAGKGGTLVLARPSFPLYESHSQYDGLPYTPWELNSELEYDVAKLPPLPRGSLVLFASPNNPVGNVLPKATLVDLLRRFPDTLFVADEAYYEYAAEPYTELIAEHANLMLLRTFSKTMGCAGVRVGYVVAHDSYLQLLRKLRLPYLLNHFALACAEVLLDDPETRAHLQKIQTNAVAQRELVYRELKTLEARGGFQVKASSANFLLLRWRQPGADQVAYKALVAAGILVRNVASGPGLAGCLRITLGDEAENQALLTAFRSHLSV